MKNKGILKKIVAAFAIVTVLVYQVLPMTKVFAEGAYTVTFTFEDNWKGETLGDNRISVYKEGQDGNNITELRTDMDDNNSVVGSSSCSQDGSSCTITVESGVPTYLATGAHVKNFNFSTQIAGNMNLTIGDGQSGQFEPSYLVNFEGASWTIDNITVTATVAGKDIASEPHEIAPDEDITLTNWDPSKMQVRISASPSGFNTLLYPTNEGVVRLNNLPENTNIPNEDITFVVEQLSGGLGESYSVNFGTASWTIGETTVTAAIEGLTLTNGAVDVDSTDRIVLTNFDSSKMVIKLVGSNNYNTTLIYSGDGTTGVTDFEEQNVTLPDETLTFVIEAKEQQQPQQPVGGDEDIEFDVAFTDTHIIMEINGVTVMDDLGELKNTYQGTVENAGTTDSNETNIIKVIQSFGDYPVATVTINGTLYTETSPNVTIDLNDGGWTIQVPGAAKYTITGTADTTANVARTIIWANIDAL